MFQGHREVALAAQFWAGCVERVFLTESRTALISGRSAPCRERSGENGSKRIFQGKAGQPLFCLIEIFFLDRDFPFCSGLKIYSDGHVGNKVQRRVWGGRSAGSRCLLGVGGRRSCLLWELHPLTPDPLQELNWPLSSSLRSERPFIERLWARALAPGVHMAHCPPAGPWPLEPFRNSSPWREVATDGPGTAAGGRG